MLRQNRRAKLFAVLICLTLFFIFANSLQSRGESQELSRGLLDKISELLAVVGIEIDSQNDHWLRKLAHFSEFGLLGLELSLFAWSLGKRGVQPIVNCASFALASAVADESLQLISARGSQVQDILLDLSGSLCGIALGVLLTEALSRKREK